MSWWEFRGFCKGLLKPYINEIIMEYIDSYTSVLSMILATYSAFR